MIAYLDKEPGGDVVRQLVEDGEELFAHAINLIEVFYDFLADSSPAVAESAIKILEADGITERSDMDGAFWRDVASIIAARRAQAPRPEKPRENRVSRSALGARRRVQSCPRAAIGRRIRFRRPRRIGS